MPIKQEVPKYLISEDTKKWLVEYRKRLRTFKMLQKQSMEHVLRAQAIKGEMADLNQDIDFLLDQFPQKPIKEISEQV